MAEDQFECNNELNAVVIFGYKRPEHLTRVLDSITLSAKPSDFCFHIFLDGPKVSDVEDDLALVLDSAIRFKKGFPYCNVIRKPTNVGLAISIVSGLNEVFTSHNTAIVIEDDIVVNADFFNVMNHFLEKLNNNPQIGSLAGFNDTKFPFAEREDFLLSRRHSSWGWATWADRWNQVDWELLNRDESDLVSLNKKVKKVSPDLTKFAEMQRLCLIDSWATIFNYDLISKGLLCVVPRHSMVKNIGLDGSGTHRDLIEIQTSSTFFSDLKDFNFTKILNNLRVSKFYNFKVRWTHSLWNKWHIRTAVRFRNTFKSHAVWRLFVLKNPRI